MIKVECPSCSAPYELDERRLPGSGLRMRCPKCSASFHVNKDGTVGEAPPPRKPKKTQMGMGIAPPVAPPGAIAPPGGAPRAPAPPKPAGRPMPPMPKPPARPGGRPAKARKATMVGVGASGAIAPPAAPPRRAPLAPAFPSAPQGGLPKPGDLAPAGDPDLPARKSKRGGTVDFELSEPGEDLNLSGLGSAADDADLPAPVGAKRRIPDMDLPTPVSLQTTPKTPPKRAPIAPPIAPPVAMPSPMGGDMDLPAPLTGDPVSGMEMPAPAPVAAPEPAFDDIDLDLPAPKAAESGFGELDLPMPKPAGHDPKGQAPGLVDAQPEHSFADLGLEFADAPKPRQTADMLGVDLPGVAGVTDLPGVAGAGPDLLDLPGVAGGGVDLPGVAGGVDLPGVAGGGLDLPGVAGAVDLPGVAGGGVDLPGVAGGVDLPGVAGGVDLPGVAGGLDLPGVAGGVDLPGVAGGVDLPGVSGGVDLPGVSGGLDLPGVSHGADLPAVSGGIDLLSDDGGLAGGDDLVLDPPDEDEGYSDDAFADLELPGLGGDDFGDAGFGGDDDLALPEPRRRGAPERGGEGTASYGEFDLGGDDGSELDLGGGGGDDGLEFTGLPQDEAEDDLGDLPEVGAEGTKRKKKKRSRTRPESGAPPKKKRTGLIALVATLALFVGAGFALKFTPHGMFGIYFVEQFLPEAGSEGSARQAIEAAETAAAPDTYMDARAGLQGLAEARRQEGLNRLLLTRSVVHEALFQIRFGEDLQSQAREQRILERLRIRSNEAPGMSLALAASALSDGELATAASELANARNGGPDAYVDLVAGELALAQGNHAQAQGDFAQAVEHGAGARGQWGVARAAQAVWEQALAETLALEGAEDVTEEDIAGAREVVAAARTAFSEATEATLALSPHHSSALIAQARLGRDSDTDGAIAALERAVGRTGTDEEPALRPSRMEKAEGYTLLGSIHERGGHRGAARTSYEAAIDAEPYSVEALAGLGRLLMGERRYRDALARFEAAETAIGDVAGSPGELPFVVQAKLGQTEALLALDQVQQAHAKVGEIVNDYGSLPEVALAYGNTHEALEEFETAAELFEQSIQLDDTRFAGYLALSQLHFSQDRPRDAAAVMQRAREHVEMTAEVRRALGESELQRQDLPAAEREFRAALGLDAENAGAQFGLGVSLRRSGRLPAATRAFDRLAELDPDYPGLALERGRIQEATGEAEDAIRSYERALEERPDDLDLVIRLGAAQVAAGRLDDAEASIERVRSERPDSAEAEHYKGRVAFLRNQLPTALSHLGRAVALDPEVAEYHLHFGWAHLASNNLGRANEETTRAIELDSGLGDAYYVRGELSLRTGAVRDALADFQKALELKPSLLDAYAGMGEALDRLGMQSQAVQAYNAAISRNGNRGEWHFRVGRLHLAQGNRGEALAALTRATDLLPSEDPPSWAADAHRIRADVHRLSGDGEAALTHYRQYLELAPPSSLDREEVQRYVRRLSE